MSKKKRLRESGAAPQHGDFISDSLAWLSSLADDVLMVNRKKDADLEDLTSFDSSAEPSFSEDEYEDEYSDDGSAEALFSEDEDEDEDEFSDDSSAESSFSEDDYEDEFSDDGGWESTTRKDKSDNDPWPF